MFEPVRGGTRGGQAEFKWSDVSADKDREVRFCYTLLHIILNSLAFMYRIILGIVSTLPQEGGKRIRTFIGIREIRMRVTKRQ